MKKKIVTKKQAIEAYKKTISEIFLAEEGMKEAALVTSSILCLLGRLFQLSADEKEELLIYAVKTRTALKLAKEAVGRIKKPEAERPEKYGLSDLINDMVKDVVGEAEHTE